jgi:hypothetical protein
MRISPFIFNMEKEDLLIFTGVSGLTYGYTTYWMNKYHEAFEFAGRISDEAKVAKDLYKGAKHGKLSQSMLEKLGEVDPGMKGALSHVSKSYYESPNFKLEFSYKLRIVKYLRSRIESFIKQYKYLIPKNSSLPKFNKDGYTEVDLELKYKSLARKAALANKIHWRFMVMSIFSFLSTVGLGAMTISKYIQWLRNPEGEEEKKGQENRLLSSLALSNSAFDKLTSFATFLFCLFCLFCIRRRKGCLLPLRYWLDFRL